MQWQWQWLPKTIDIRCAFTIQYGDTCSEFTDFNEAQEILFGSVPGRTNQVGCSVSGEKKCQQVVSSMCSGSRVETFTEWQQQHCSVYFTAPNCSHSGAGSKLQAAKPYQSNQAKTTEGLECQKQLLDKAQAAHKM